MQVYRARNPKKLPLWQAGRKASFALERVVKRSVRQSLIKAPIVKLSDRPLHSPFTDYDRAGTASSQPSLPLMDDASKPLTNGSFQVMDYYHESNDHDLD
jgi:hypothetical protein